METRSLEQHKEEIQARRQSRLPVRNVSSSTNRLVHGLMGNEMDFRMSPEKKKEWALFVNAIA